MLSKIIDTLRHEKRQLEAEIDSIKMKSDEKIRDTQITIKQLSRKRIDIMDMEARLKHRQKFIASVAGDIQCVDKNINYILKLPMFEREVYDIKSCYLAAIHEFSDEKIAERKLELDEDLRRKRIELTKIEENIAKMVQKIQTGLSKPKEQSPEPSTLDIADKLPDMVNLGSKNMRTVRFTDENDEVDDLSFRPSQFYQ